jgi:hypothetical protein
MTDLGWFVAGIGVGWAMWIVAILVLRPKVIFVEPLPEGTTLPLPPRRVADALPRVH